MVVNQRTVYLGYFDEVIYMQHKHSPLTLIDEVSLSNYKIYL